MQRIMLVRHAEPEVEIDKPAAEWALTERGVESARRLAAELARFEPARIVASPERKALETGRILSDVTGLMLIEDARCAEQGAEPGEFLADYGDFRALVRRHFEHPGEIVMRGESSDAAAARFAKTVELSQIGGGVPVVVSHGRIMASWLASLAGASAWDIWSELRLPDLIEVDLDGKSFRSIPFPLH